MVACCFLAYGAYPGGVYFSLTCDMRAGAEAYLCRIVHKDFSFYQLAVNRPTEIVP